MPEVSIKNDNFTDTDDDESCSISELLFMCHDGTDHNHATIDESTDNDCFSSLCGDALASHLTQLDTTKAGNCGSIPFSPSLPSLIHTYNGDDDSESASLDLLYNQISHDGENTATSSECISRERHSDRVNPPEPPIMFANVLMNRICNRSNATPDKSAPAASIPSTSNILIPPLQSLSYSSRLQEIKARRRSIETKYSHSVQLSLSGARVGGRAPSLNFVAISSNKNDTSTKSQCPSHQCSDKNGSALQKRSNAEVVTGMLLSLPLVSVTWFLCFEVTTMLAT